MKKKNLSLFPLVVLFALIVATPAFSATPPSSHQWTFTLPTDAPYEICTIEFFADGRNAGSGQLQVSRGSSVHWSSVKPLSYVIGWCGAAGYALTPRTCSGTDSTNGSTLSAAACETNVTLKICPKNANANPYNSLSYGFCPE